MTEQALAEEEFADEDEMDSAQLSDFSYALGRDHHVSFTRRGPELLISFDTLPADVSAADLAAHGAALDPLAREMDWSVLHLASRGATWFRDPQVIAYFDALVDGTLLDQFGPVLFYGAGPGGHAALSYALCAPGARVMALAPQASLDAAALEWDRRWGAGPEARDFTGRYAVNAANLSAAERVFLCFDPHQPADARHAEAVRAAPNVTPLRSRHQGGDPAASLAAMGVLDDLVCDAMAGDLTPRRFYRALRARFDHVPYLRRLIARLNEAGHELLEAIALRAIARRTGRARYGRRFETVSEALAARGVKVPPARG